MTVATNLFVGFSHLVETEDQSGVVIEIEDMLSTTFGLTSASLQALVSINGFLGCLLSTTFDFPLLLTWGKYIYELYIFNVNKHSALR